MNVAFRCAPRTRVLALAAVAGLVGAAWAGTTRTAFVPDPAADDAAMLEGATWIGLGSGFTLRVQRIDEQQRLAYISRLTGVDVDPFATPPGQAPRFLTFIVELENNAAGTLVFRSAQCWLVTNKSEHTNPLEMDTLRSLYGVMGSSMSPAYERVGAAFLPVSANVEPGGRLAGLLVYRQVKPGTRRYRLELQITSPSGDVTTVVAPYKRVQLPADN